MKDLLNKIGYNLRRAYRITIDLRNAEKVFWNDLKEYHAQSNYTSGVFEKEKTIESNFEIIEDKLETFFYKVDDGFFFCRVKILQDFPQELTTDIFILSSHFNNLLNYGVVKVNTESQYVEYQLKREILLPLLFNAEIDIQTILHLRTSKDIFWAFKRLMEEQESPVIIIADLLRNKENEEKQNE